MVARSEPRLRVTEPDHHRPRPGVSHDGPSSQPAEARSEPERCFHEPPGASWLPLGPLSTCTCRLHYSAIDVYIYIEPSLFLLPLKLLCCSLVACFLNTSYSREGSRQGSRHQPSIVAPLDFHFAPPDLDVGAPRPRCLNVLGLFLCYITTLLHCYVVTLLLWSWRGGRIAALLRCWIYIYIIFL